MLSRLKTDRNYRAYIQINFTATHAPYSGNSSIPETESFCRSFPAECKGVSPADLQKYIAIDDENHGGLSYDFDKTVRKLGLNSTDIEKLARVLEVTYKSSVRLLDNYFGQTLDAVKKTGLLDESIIVFTSDHGEMLYRKDSPIKWTHWGLEQEVLSIPLIIRLPNSALGKTVYRNVTRSIDVFPTLAGLSEIKIRPNNEIDGVDLSGALFKETRPPHLIAYSCGGLLHPAVKIQDVRQMPVLARDRDKIYVLFPKTDGELGFREKSIGHEQLWDDLLDDRVQIEEKLKQYRRNLISGYKADTDKSEWEEVREQLRSLGYLH